MIRNLQVDFLWFKIAKKLRLRWSIFFDFYFQIRQNLWIRDILFPEELVTSHLRGFGRNYARLKAHEN
jgi:hypothetical protein